MRRPSYSSETHKKCSSNSTVTTSAFSHRVHEAPHHDYGVYLTKERQQLVICDSNPIKSPLYFADLGQFKKGKPDVTLYTASPSSLNPVVNMNGSKLSKSEGKTGTIIAVAHFPSFTRRIEMGFGDPYRPDTQTWETMTKPGRGKWEFFMPTRRDKEYHCSFRSDPNADLASHQQGQRYQWQRAHSTADGLDNPAYARNLSLSNYKLVNEEGQIVALFISNGMQSFNKLGRLRIFRERLNDRSNSMSGIDKEVELRIIMTYCGIEGKARRG